MIDRERLSLWHRIQLWVLCNPVDAVIAAAATGLAVAVLSACGPAHMACGTRADIAFLSHPDKPRPAAIIVAQCADGQRKQWICADAQRAVAGNQQTFTCDGTVVLVATETP